MKILKELKGADHSVKYLLGLEDGQSVETLYMYDKDMCLTYHSTVCVSSQAGCAMGCRFCATGAQGFTRDLTADEILAQTVICEKGRCRDGLPPLDAVVFAGMGEPLMNDKNVMAAMEKIRDRLGIDHFELATVGIVPKIYELAQFVIKSGIHLRLNLSLHAATDEKRRALIPWTAKYGIEPLVDAAADYASTTGTTARIRYMLMKGLNDTDGDIDRLRILLKNRPTKLIISSYNDNNMNGLTPADTLDVLNFYHKIKDDFDCDIFHNFGGAISGGCGQLRRQEQAS